MSPYYMETGIQYPQDLLEETLNLAKNNPDKLIPRDRVWRKISTGMPYEEMASILGQRPAREIKRRHILATKIWPNQNPIKFCQYSLPKYLEDAYLDMCPSWMKTLGREELSPILQISYGGEILHPHKGHLRKASIFCLLEGGGETTRWYKETEPFEVISDYRIPDFSKLETAFEVQIPKNKWIVFNHAIWHSVHANPNNTQISGRINVGIDFNTLSAEQFELLLKQNS